MPDPDAARRVSAARVARLGTTDPDGRPHLVPICFALAGQTVYSAIDWKPKRTRELRRLRNIRERGWATLLVDHYEEDWSALWWVRLRGTARVLEGGEEFDEAMAVLAEKYAQYRRDPPPGPVIALDVAEWRSWSGRPPEC